jgi:putative NIF3 family GTP cyclohydrolase 1 type 2
MRAREVREHFRSVGTWVDWERTCDQFLHGDPETEVAGIATTWIPSRRVVEQAAARGANLLITHEQFDLPFYRKDPSIEEQVRRKRELLDELGLVVLRCHDTWDRMPEAGIPDAWASWLGFPAEPRPTESFYKVCLLGDTTVEEAARRVLERVRELGQDTVLIFGDRRQTVSRMAVGTGAITHVPGMRALGADILLVTDDGVNSWTGALWAADLDIPLLVVNHCTAEKPGMMAMVGYLRGQFPGIPVEYIDNPEYPYRSVH